MQSLCAVDAELVAPQLRAVGLYKKIQPTAVGELVRARFRFGGFDL